MESVRGTIGFIRYKTSAEVGDFYIFSFEPEKSAQPSEGGLPDPFEPAKFAKGFSVKGESSFDLKSGMKVVVRGELSSWKGEPQINASYIAPDVEVSNKGARGWLKTLPVSGFGDRTLKKLLDRHPSDLNRVLESVPALVAAGVKEKVAQALADGWAILNMPPELLELFDIDGLSPKLVTRIMDTYGSRIHDILDSNPWDLARSVRGVGFKSADEIARQHGVDMEADERYIALIEHVIINEMSSSGHTLMTENDILRSARSLGFSNADRILGVLANLIQEGGSVIREPLSGMYGSRWLYDQERALSKNIIRLLASETSDSEEECRKRVIAAEKALGIELDESQRVAAVGAVKHKVCIITGGPGTGKSTTQSVILHAINRDPEEKVCLVAPTGRAARRLAGATKGEASTIHRALVFDPMEGGFVHTAHNPLPHSTAISDEFSMVDVELANAFASALSDGTRLIIVGDDKQLPSVGQGQVLADLIKSGAIPVYRLSVIHRQAQKSGIITAAHAMSNGEMPEFNDRDFLFVSAPRTEDIQREIVDLVKTRMPSMGFKDQDEIMILTPQRKGPIGSAELNKLIKGVLNPAEKEKLGHTVSINGVLWSKGDKVMHVKNNYEKNVFNGEMGTVSSVEVDAEEARIVHVTYPDKEGSVSYDKGDIKELDFAWASTIHKVQGSEAASVALVLSRQHRYMLERCLVFTGETRAKKVCFAVGEKEALQLAVRNERASLRQTGLCSYLREEAGLEQLAQSLPEPAKPPVRGRTKVRVKARPRH